MPAREPRPPPLTASGAPRVAPHLARVGIVRTLEPEHCEVERWSDAVASLVDALASAVHHPAPVNLIATIVLLDCGDAGCWLARFAPDDEDLLILVADGHLRARGAAHVMP
ncbi:MAG: hypothetical protein RMA76_42640 [Deltaproteobacteria bacterium]|jgi:hypothetical protein